MSVFWFTCFQENMWFSTKLFKIFLYSMNIGHLVCTIYICKTLSSVTFSFQSSIWLKSLKVDQNLWGIELPSVSSPFSGEHPLSSPTFCCWWYNNWIFSSSTESQGKFIIQIHKSLTFVGDCISHSLLASPGQSMVIMVVVSAVLRVHWDARTGQQYADTHGEWMGLLVWNVPNCHQILNAVENY